MSSTFDISQKWLSLLRIVVGAGRRSRRRRNHLSLKSFQPLERRAAPGDITGIGAFFANGFGHLPNLEVVLSFMSG
ncbi:MAG: hypothetical protein KDA89_21510 [Planctomycetaceae bacterium]|nr:hypothetical protein [Planctomycetaceae bacterium]